MVKRWLKKRLSVQEAETEYMLTDERLGKDPVTFGFCDGEWKELLARMQPGDEIWNYRSPPTTWHGHCGRAGVVLVRKGKIIADLCTDMS